MLTWFRQAAATRGVGPTQRRQLQVQVGRPSPTRPLRACWQPWGGATPRDHPHHRDAVLLPRIPPRPPAAPNASTCSDDPRIPGRDHVLIAASRGWGTCTAGEDLHPRLRPSTHRPPSLIWRSTGLPHRRALFLIRLPPRPRGRRRLPARPLAAILNQRLPTPPARHGVSWESTTSSAFSGNFVGLILGGLLAPIELRLVFLISVPVGPLRHRLGLSQLKRSRPRSRKIDWWERPYTPCPRLTWRWSGDLRDSPLLWRADRLGHPPRPRPAVPGGDLADRASCPISSAGSRNRCSDCPFFKIRAFTFARSRPSSRRSPAAA